MRTSCEFEGDDALVLREDEASMRVTSQLAIAVQKRRDEIPSVSVSIRVFLVSSISLLVSGQKNQITTLSCVPPPFIIL